MHYAPKVGATGKRVFGRVKPKGVEQVGRKIYLGSG
jgi:hypothetical protein